MSLEHEKKSFLEKITLRLAREDDVLNVYNLANEKEVRMRSVKSENIDYSEHKRWYAEKLSDENTLFLIAEREGEFAAQIRFSIEGISATIGISIMPFARGYGAASYLIDKSIEALKNAKPFVEEVWAQIKPDNLASIRSFEKAGFEKEGEKDIGDVHLFEYIYRVKEVC